jgi:hypothetical protein
VVSAREEERQALDAHSAGAWLNAAIAPKASRIARVLRWMGRARSAFNFALRSSIVAAEDRPAAFTVRLSSEREGPHPSFL